MKTIKPYLFGALLVSALGAFAHDGQLSERRLRRIFNQGVRYTDEITFPGLITNGDPVRGHGEFGVTLDDTAIDTTNALFNGLSVIYGPVVSNGTACSSCHRPEAMLMLPVPPLSAHIPASDVLFKGRNSEAQGDPRMAPLFENLGLTKIRVNRFNPTRPESDPFRRIFGWRKTQTIVNMAFSYGLLTDLRARGPIEQARGASFTHTQDSDVRFDDLVNPHLPDIAAYMQTVVSDPILNDLLNPASMNYQNLVNDPFYTVHTTSDLEEEGKQVFAQQCMGCHDMPNVFSNRDHQDGPGPNFPPPYGHAMDIGVAQRNANHLDFRYYDAATGRYSVNVLPLAREDGATIMWPVTDDVGTAMTTGRYEDLHRFKVPQLRLVSKLAPYFHDNSAATLEEVVDYFNSDDYNDSADGRAHPIHLNRRQRAAVLALLRIL